MPYPKKHINNWDTTQGITFCGLDYRDPRKPPLVFTTDTMPDVVEWATCKRCVQSAQKRFKAGT